MSRVIFDVSAMSAPWFKKIQEQLLTCRKVRGVSTKHGKYAREVNKTLRLILAELGRAGRLDTVEPDDVEKQIQYLEGLEIWQSNSACDDPHIFAMHRCMPVTHVFTKDGRIGTCRGCLRGQIAREFSNFGLVTSKANFENHSHIIMN